MKRTFKIFFWFSYFLASFLQAAIPVDTFSVLKKRNHIVAFEEDAGIADNDSTKIRIDLEASKERQTKLKDALFSKFKNEAGEKSFGKIFEYKIGNYPKYITTLSYIWDERGMDELEAAIPSLKFKRKPENWRPAPKSDYYKNMLIINSDLMYEELLRKINVQIGQNYPRIIWVDLAVTGWPEGVPKLKSLWNLENILSIYRNLALIQFTISKSNLKLSIDDSTASRAEALLSKIYEKFFEKTKLPVYQIRKYIFKPWPKCLSQIPKFWDNEAVDEIERILPQLDFLPKSSGSQLNSRRSRDCYRDELYDSILQTINSKLNVQLHEIPWDLIDIDGWPDDAPKKSYLTTQVEILRVFRAIPKMEFKWKSGAPPQIQKDAPTVSVDEPTKNTSSESIELARDNYVTVAGDGVVMDVSDDDFRVFVQDYLIDY